MTRTWCKYKNCSLEKLEKELDILNKIWTSLEKNWIKPNDVEDLYRVYPLLDTTASIARKMTIKPNGDKIKKYKVDTVLPTNDRTIDTSIYLFPDESNFFNSKNEQKLLADIVSVFLHSSEYKYMDTRKVGDNSNFKIYVFVKTDILCQSCAKINLKKPSVGKNNFRKTTALIRYSDCTCGTYINVRSYINSVFDLLKDNINKQKI